jgi:hypothetical protein
MGGAISQRALHLRAFFRLDVSAPGARRYGKAVLGDAAGDSG